MLNGNCSQIFVRTRKSMEYMIQASAWNYDLYHAALNATQDQTISTMTFWSLLGYRPFFGAYSKWPFSLMGSYPPPKHLFGGFPSYRNIFLFGVFFPHLKFAFFRLVHITFGLTMFKNIWINNWIVLTSLFGLYRANHILPALQWNDELFPGQQAILDIT